MTENKNSADLLDLLLQSLTGQTVAASFAHMLLALDDERQNYAACTQPQELVQARVTTRPERPGNRR